uniref:uncharacterized protein LOC122588640 n=1 Tax=Erigeron canadensis TaxID=72917 RepID=UPI001CB99D34|nr:uncharacterized protein LOC122588640 [Erigeron canadensis]
MLQRQIMFKQLEELQRQKKLQELNDQRQQNVINQQSVIHDKQASGVQYAPLINGTPVRDASQMFMFGNGNTNLVQGFQNRLPYSQAQNQVLRSMGLASQPVDAHSFSNLSHFQGAIHESTGEQVDTISRSSLSDQYNVSYQAKNMFGPGFSQGLDMGSQTGNDQQEFGRGHEQDINPSQDFTSLDPLEQKFLFSTDDDSLGGFGSMFDDTDNSQALPSLQSGTWSALMQSALEETSSTDTGVQEEWSGLSFQNPELSNDNQPPNIMESGKNLPSWQNNNFQNASSLTARQEDLKSSNASSSFPSFQQSHKEGGGFEASAQAQRFSHLQVHQRPGGHDGEFGFVHDASSNGEEFNKGVLPSKASDMTTLRSSESSGMSAIVDRPADFPTADSNSQTSRHMLELFHKVDKLREYRHSAPSTNFESLSTNVMPKPETADAQTPSNNYSAPPFGFRLASPTQRPPVNYFGLSQISRPPDTSHIVQLKDQDGQRSLMFEGQQVSNSMRKYNTSVDNPSQPNLSGMGSYKTISGSPSASDVSHSRIETTSEVPKESGVANNVLEASGHVLNSQGFDYSRGQEGKFLLEEDAFPGRANANASLKKVHISPLNPTYSDPNARPTLKKEMVDSDPKAPQLNSVYENYRNLLMASAEREDQMVKRSSNPSLHDASQPRIDNSFVQMNLADTSQNGIVKPLSGTNTFAVNQSSSPYMQYIDVPKQPLPVYQSKKRKFSTYELLPWYKEVTQGSSRLQDMSIAELEWAQAAIRVPEKLKEHGEASGDSPSMVHPKKRIIFTTQLMQVLFRPAPAAILSADATACYNSVTYFAARFALGDACGLAKHSHMPCDISDSLSDKKDISKRSGENLSKTVEDFIDRAKKLEDELLRLENGGSYLEIRMETQDLERFAVINRFAKFHSRAQMVVAEPASSGGPSTVPKLYPQRYVTASQMPKIVPAGHNCISL